jgi:WD40 repeat protein
MTARVWDAMTGKELAKLTGREAQLLSATFSPDRRRVVTAGERTARVWDATTGKEVAKLTGHEAQVLSAAFSPDGQRVVTAAAFDMTARVWDATTGKELAKLIGHENFVWSAAFNPDGQRVVTAGDRTARVWDVHWLTRYKRHDLIEAVCREKLVAAAGLTERDVTVAPILSGRQGEDVCTSSPLIARIISTVRSKLRAIIPASTVTGSHE